MSKAIKMLSFLTVLVIIFGAVGVQASWRYLVVTEQVNETLSIDFLIPEPIPWEDKDILPPEHARLIELFVQEINDPDSIIHDRTKDRLTGFLDLNWFGQKDTLGSMDEDGQALRELFSCENSSFIVKMDAEKKWVSGPFWDKEYEITYKGFTVYTTETSLSGHRTGDWIDDVYKTTFILDENGKWVADESTCGRAPYANYDVEWSSSSIPSFDISKWQEVQKSS